MTQSFEGLYEQLDALEGLPSDWHEGGYDPPNFGAIALAKNILCEAVEIGIMPARVDASTAEGVCVAFCDGEKYADIETFNDDGVLATTFIRNELGQPSIWEVDSLRATLERIKSFITEQPVLV